MSKRLIPGKLVTLSKFGESSRWLSMEHLKLEDKVGLLYEIVKEIHIDDKKTMEETEREFRKSYYNVLTMEGKLLGYNRKELKLYKD